MNCRCYISSFAFFTLCLCVVLSKNVENARQKKGIAEGKSCETLKSSLIMFNVTADPSDTRKGDICGGECCTPEVEVLLKKEGQKHFADIVRHNTISLQGSLSSFAGSLQEHITELANISENRTLVVLLQVYQNMFPSTKVPISNLYSDIRRYIQINDSQDALLSSNMDIKGSVSKFFVDMFPVAYQQAIDALTNEFSADYQICLKKIYDDAQPFGEIPNAIGQSLSKSLESARMLFQALRIGVGVLNVSDKLIIEDNSKSNSECHDALMKMTHCPKCLGMKTSPKPCPGYCLNVWRGCLSNYVAHLESPWNGYVEVIERLVKCIKEPNNEAGFNADFVIRYLDGRISEAIMHVIKKKDDIDNRVKRSCGPPTFSKTELSVGTNSSDASMSGTGKQRKKTQALPPLPLNEITKFLSSISRSKNFYGDLSDTLCNDDDFVEPKDRRCWNGERIGEYTKLVAPGSLDAQKYNPEVQQNADLQNVDSRIANLADQLQHVHQMVVSSLGVVNLPQSDSYINNDGAEGSGSGNGFPDEDIDDDDTHGSGSGDGSDVTNDPIPEGPVQRVPGINIHPVVTTQQPKTGGSCNIYSSATLVLLLSTFVMKYIA